MGIVWLAAVEIESEAGERAARLLGQTVLEFDALREPQLAGPYYLAAASYALWRGDVADAGLSAERGWALVKATEEWVLAARMAATVARVDAASARKPANGASSPRWPRPGRGPPTSSRPPRPW